MSKHKPATLGAGFLTKGQATPTPAIASGLASLNQTSQPIPAPAPAGPVASQTKLSLKLDQARYRALKLAGIESGKTSQDILTEALDAWLAIHQAGATR